MASSYSHGFLHLLQPGQVVPLHTPPVGLVGGGGVGVKRDPGSCSAFRFSLELDRGAGASDIPQRQPPTDPVVCQNPTHLDPARSAVFWRRWGGQCSPTATVATVVP